MASLQERVNRGAELLDTLTPNWYKKINLKSLDLGSPDACVLGQAFKEHFSGGVVELVEKAIKEITKSPLASIRLFADDDSKITTLRAALNDINTYHDGSPEIDANYYGFDSDNGGTDYDKLTALWTDKIQARKKAKAAGRVKA